MTNIKRKSIAFNIDDPYQKELYDYVSRYQNFSYYGKRVVTQDYEKFKSKQAEKEMEENNSGIKLKLK